MLTVSKKGGQKLKGLDLAPGGEKGRFGTSVVVEGNALIVSAPKYIRNNNAKTYAFARASPDDMWEFQQELPRLIMRFRNSTATPQESEATVFAMSGNTMVAAFPTPSPVWVLTRENSGWRHQVELTIQGDTALSHTGPLGVSGGTAVAACTKGGRIHVFERSAPPAGLFGSNLAPVPSTTPAPAPTSPFSRAPAPVPSTATDAPQWTKQATLTVSEDASPSIRNLEISGDVIVASTQNFVGTVYVFVRSESGDWTQEAKLTSPEGGFGSSIAIDGTTLGVGAADNGIAYVFERTEMGTWMETTRLAGEGKNISVAISGDKIAVGTPPPKPTSEFTGVYNHGSMELKGHLCSGNDFKGSVRIYKRSGYMWEEDFRLEASDGEVSDLFGSSVAISGNTVVVGAPGDGDGRGAVYTL